MKKIIIACRAYYPDVAGGGEISTKTLSETLVALGFDVTVIAISNSNKKEVVDNVAVHRVAYKNVYWSYENKNIGPIKKIAWHVIDSNNLLMEGELKRLIKEIKPSILITSTIEDVSSVIWKVAKAQNIRTVHILRSYSLLCPNANMFKDDNCNTRCGLCKVITLPKRINSKYVDDVVGISHFVADKHIENGYFPNAKKHVIYNICLDYVANERVYNGFATKKIKIGYLGRVHKTKGIDLIFDAVSKLDSQQKAMIEIEVAGTGSEDYINELKSLAEKHAVTCHFHGNRKANEFLDSLDLLIVPSKWNEPFGRVLIESMGRNVPVAAKTVGGIPEILSENTEFLFDDVDGLTKVMNKYLRNEIAFNFNLDEFKTENIIRKWDVLLSN